MTAQQRKQKRQQRTNQQQQKRWKRRWTKKTKQDFVGGVLRFSGIVQAGILIVDFFVWLFHITRPAIGV